MKIPQAFSLALLFLVTTSGCVMYTSVNDEARREIHFSTAKAAQSFYDAYLGASSPTGRGNIAVYLAPPYWHRTVDTDNIRFNAAVESADTDHDGIISDPEALAYSAKLKPKG